MRRPDPRTVTVTLTRKEWGAILDSIWSVADHLDPKRGFSMDPVADRRTMHAHERLAERIQRQVGGQGIHG